MAFKTFTDGVALPASDLNTYLMKQSVIVCTSGTRPSSPVEGMVVYETDTDAVKVYSTATTTWQPPWNLPWGRIAHATQTTIQSGITSAADLTSLSVAPTLLANRYYRVTLAVPLLQNTSTGIINLYAVSGGTTVASSGLTLAATEYATLYATAILTGSGSTTIKGQAGTSAGTLSTNVSSTAPALLYVEDIGPSAAPA